MRGSVAEMVDRDAMRELVARALAEDLGPGDITSQATVPADTRAAATIVQKQPGVVFGLEVAAEAFAQAGGDGFERIAIEGEWRDSVPVDVALVNGPARALLGAERTGLNLLCHLSGVATLTARFVDAVAETGAAILDTRKTTPGLRALEKYAVRCGGGTNHRLRLDDGVLIKDNHLRLAGSVGAAVELAKGSGAEVEVECESLEEVREALATGADWLLLDNMSPSRLVEAVALVASRAKLEASGGITLDNVREVAETGVDFISIGALTHSARALDVSMEVL